MAHDSDVFLNCPFDDDYADLFWGITFTIHDCGFVARCSLEIDDATGTRIDKIYRLIEQSPYGIHDISRTELDAANNLPRFNMPLELGIFLGAKRYGYRMSDKACLILDSERYRFQKFCSDIAGQDIKAHNGSTTEAIRVVRDWLRQWLSADARLPGGKRIAERYAAFRAALPIMCDVQELDPQHLPYVDEHKLIIGWLRENP